MDKNNLVAWLPFDTSPTEDKCGNEWTIVGSLAVEDGALALESSSTRNYIYTTPPELGMSDFTIDWWEYIPASVNSFTGQMLGIDGTTGSNTRCLALAYWRDSAPSMDLGRGTGASWSYDAKSIGTKIRDQWVHRAVVRSGNTIYAFENGTLFTSMSFSDSISVLGSSLFIGNFARENRQFVGKLKNVRIYVGAALWTANFTPPTADDYIQLAMELDGYAPISLDFDIERQVNNTAKMWRYVNAGTADDLLTSGTTLTDLPESKSKTGTAFYQTQRAKCFDLPATNEIWIKFDVYFDGSNRWRAYNGGNNGITGITAQSDGGLSFFANETNVSPNGANIAGVCKVNQLQTVLLHMITGSSAGVVEAWVDGTKIYRYTGDVNHGEDFADIYLQSDGAGTFFSNVIISNAEIELGEGWQIFTFDVERQVAKAFDFDFDVERQVQNIVPFQLDFDVELKELLPVDLSADLERKVIVLVDLSADTELLSIVLVDFTADLARNIKANINLYKTDVSEYFSGGSSAPIVIPTQEVVPPATDSEAVTQSIEITIAEQQITDQVKVVTAIPLDIMYPVQGQYLDYCCDMRVERVSKQGILYTADCCSDLDELLYTPLNYDMPNILRTTIEKSSSGGSKPKYVTITMPCEASKHVEKFADALGLEPVMQFEDFYTSVEVPNQKESGATYADLLRDIFSWSSRVLTQVINVYIRNGKLFVIQRGHESNVIDISNADITTPVYQHELIRLYYQRNKITTTITRTATLVIREPVKRSSEVSVGDAETTYEYDDDNLLESSRTVTYDRDYNEIVTTTDYSYTELSNGRKVLVKEYTVKYVNGKFEEETTTYHTPLDQGLAHSVRLDEDGDIIGEGVGQNSNDDRVTPYQKHKELEDDYTEETSSTTTTKTIEGLALIDTSFPIPSDLNLDMSNWGNDDLPADIRTAIERYRRAVSQEKGRGRLQQITDDIKDLNRKTKETVTLSIYNFPHVIDFNDRIILFGEEYFLVSNRAQTTPRIYNEQNLTLVRWY